MSVWIQNLTMALETKGVAIVHGNVRDVYIDTNDVLGSSIRVFSQLTPLLGACCGKLSTTFHDFVTYSPFKVEAIECLTHQAAVPTETNELDAELEVLSGRAPAGSQSRRQAVPEPQRVFSHWARGRLQDRTRNSFVVLSYLDKVITYRTSYQESELEALYWLEKCVENITPNNRLVLIALSDSLLPVELYTHSPKCRLFQIPLPDKADRSSYLRHQVGSVDFTNQLALLADLTDGLYLRDLDEIARGYREIAAEHSPGTRDVVAVVNKYRLGVQEDHFTNLDIQRLNTAFSWFRDTEGVKGQDHVLGKVCSVLFRARAGLAGIASGTSAKPKGVLFFAGPPGVGKTLIAKKLAKFLFSTEEAFIRIDMSELKEEHSMSKLIGAPPGYVGFEQGGVLTGKVRERPFSVVLFDEIEKAHPRILDLFLQLLDEGRLTDSRGQAVLFTETIVVFTSNIGNRSCDRAGLDKILQDPTLSEVDRLHAAQNHFRTAVQRFFEQEISRPELLRRIGNSIVPFNHIRDHGIQREIVRAHLIRCVSEVEDRYREKGYSLAMEIEQVTDFLVDRYGDHEMARFGGGGVTNAIEDEIIDALASEILAAEYRQSRNVAFRVVPREGRLVIEL